MVLSINLLQVSRGLCPLDVDLSTMKIAPFRISGQGLYCDLPSIGGWKTNISLHAMSRVLRRDEPGPALEGGIVPDPEKHDDKAIAETDQEHEVQNQPREPGEYTGKL